MKELTTTDNWWRAQKELVAENKTATEKQAEGVVSIHGA